jgi:hypothetical protein
MASQMNDKTNRMYKRNGFGPPLLVCDKLLEVAHKLTPNAELEDMMLFFWGKDPSAARRPAFDIAPCLLGAGVSDYTRVQTIFEGMLGFLRIAQRPELCLKSQPPGLISLQKMVWVDGQYDRCSKRVTVWMPQGLADRDDVQMVADTLAHEIAHHYLLTENDEFGRKVSNEVLTDVAAVWIGFGSVMVAARQKRASIYEYMNEQA